VLHFQKWVRVNQQPPMHQLAILSIGWAPFFHLALDTVHHNPFFFIADHCFFSFLGSWPFFPWTWPHTYLPYSLSYPHKSYTNLGTLFIIPYWLSYPIDLATILTTYPTNLATLHTQSLYWHKYFTNLITLIR